MYELMEEVECGNVVLARCERKRSLQEKLGW